MLREDKLCNILLAATSSIDTVTAGMHAAEISVPPKQMALPVTAGDTNAPTRIT
jgi:hypothetical protein